MSELRNGDYGRAVMTAGILDKYLNFECYEHMSYETIVENHYDYRYTGKKKVHSRARSFADRWVCNGSHDLLCNVESHIQYCYFVASYDNVS